MLRPKIDACLSKKFLPNMQMLKCYTRQPNLTKYLLLIYYDILTISEITKILTLFQNLQQKLQKYNNIEIILINNQDEKAAENVAETKLFNNYPCYYDSGRFTQTLNERKLVTLYPYCFLFSPKGQFLFEGNCLDKEMLRMKFD